MGRAFRAVWRSLEELFGTILAYSVDIVFVKAFYRHERIVLMDFNAFWTSKNEHFAWEGSQKSNFQRDGFLMLMENASGLFEGKF